MRLGERRRTVPSGFRLPEGDVHLVDAGLSCPVRPLRFKISLVLSRFFSAAGPRGLPEGVQDADRRRLQLSRGLSFYLLDYVGMSSPRAQKTTPLGAFYLTGDAADAQGIRSQPTEPPDEKPAQGTSQRRLNEDLLR